MRESEGEPIAQQLAAMAAQLPGAADSAARPAVGGVHARNARRGRLSTQLELLLLDLLVQIIELSACSNRAVAAAGVATCTALLGCSNAAAEAALMDALPAVYNCLLFDALSAASVHCAANRS